MRLVSLLFACDDTSFHGPDRDLVGGSGLVGVVELFEQSCTSCHGGTRPVAGLDLESDPCGATIGALSTHYPGSVRIVPGDHAASVLWHKVADTGAYGVGMPPAVGTLPENAELLAAWIDAGAPCPVDTGP